MFNTFHQQHPFSLSLFSLSVSLHNTLLFVSLSTFLSLRCQCLANNTFCLSVRLFSLFPYTTHSFLPICLPFSLFIVYVLQPTAFVCLSSLSLATNLSISPLCLCFTNWNQPLLCFCTCVEVFFLAFVCLSVQHKRAIPLCVCLSVLFSSSINFFQGQKKTNFTTLKNVRANILSHHKIAR